MGFLNKVLFKIKQREILVRDLISLLLLLFIIFVVVIALLRVSGVIEETKDEETSFVDEEIEYHPITDVIEEDIKFEKDEDTIREQANTLSPCVISEINLIRIDELLLSSDLCSEPWFEELDAYITRLEIQNEELKKQEGTKEMVNVQKKLIARLKAFKKKQNDTTIDKLEEVVNAYQDVSTTICTGGN